MKPQPDPRALLQKEFLAQLPSLWPPLKGSLAFVKKPCIRKNCPACARGDKHPAWIFSFTQDGRRRCMYVPKDLVPLLRQGPKTDAAWNNSSLPSARLCFAPTVPHDPNRLEPAPPSLLSRTAWASSRRLIASKKKMPGSKTVSAIRNATPEKPPFGSSTLRPNWPSSPTPWRTTKRKKAGPNRAMLAVAAARPCTSGKSPAPSACPDPRCVRHVALASWPKVLSGAPSLTWCRPGRRSSFTNWSSATAPGVTGCSALRHPGCLPKDCWATGSAYVAQEH